MFTASDKYEHVKHVFSDMLTELAEFVESFTLELDDHTVPLVALPPQLPEHLSSVCGQCGVETDSPPITPSRIAVAGIDIHLGGDINWLHLITGLSTCAGRFFCCVCEQTRDVLHESGPEAVGAPRTLAAAIAQAKQFEAAGRPEHRMKDDAFKNCIHPPPYPGTLRCAPPSCTA